jgi:hypothetical protein
VTARLEAVTKPRVFLVAALAVLCAAMLSASAGASAPKPFLYWAGYSSGNIGRADIGGAGFTGKWTTGGNITCGDVAVTTKYIYWTNYTGNTIGRSKLDGTGIDQNFITNAGGPCGIVAYAGHLYWANYDTDTIGKAKLDGSGVNETFVANTGDEPCGIGAGSGYVYWEDYASAEVGRVKTNGSGAKADLIPNAGEGGYGVAVDAHHVYWSNYDGKAIGRANLDGSNPNATWLATDSYATGVKVTSSYIYWGNSDAGAIGRAALNGTGVNQSFLSGVGDNYGLGISAPSTKTTLKAVKSGKRVTFIAIVTPLPDGGTVKFSVCGYAAVSKITGKAHCTNRYDGSGTVTAVARYLGDPEFYGSKSRPVTVTIK